MLDKEIRGYDNEIKPLLLDARIENDYVDDKEN